MNISQRSFPSETHVRRHLFLLSILAAATTLACSPEHATEPAAATSTPIEVRTASVARIEWTSTFDAGGIVRARQVAPIAARVMASVVDVPVRAGDVVIRGALLVALDAREMRANLDRATASVAAARESAIAAESDVSAAEASLTLARASHQRVAALAERRSATPHELDQAVAALNGAEAQLRAARARLAAAGASRDAARAGQSAADTGVSYTRLVAPFDGVVSERLVDPGAVATPGTPLLMLEDRSALQFEVRLDDTRSGLVRAGQSVDVNLGPQDTDTTWLSAQVSEIARVDPASHAFIVKATLPKDVPARSGTYGRARFANGVRTTIAVPATAVVSRGQLAFVFVVDEKNVAHLRAVSTGDTTKDRIEVLAGLSDGERVVVAPPAALTDARPVRMAESAGAQR